MMPRTFPVLAWLSPPSCPCEASISLSELRPSAHANGDSSRPIPHSRKPGREPRDAQAHRQPGLRLLRQRRGVRVGRLPPYCWPSLLSVLLAAVRRLPVLRGIGLLLGVGLLGVRRLPVGGLAVLRRVAARTRLPVRRLLLLAVLRGRLVLGPGAARRRPARPGLVRRGALRRGRVEHRPARGDRAGLVLLARLLGGLPLPVALLLGAGVGGVGVVGPAGSSPGWLLLMAPLSTTAPRWAPIGQARVVQQPGVDLAQPPVRGPPRGRRRRAARSGRGRPAGRR